ncbi:MAG: ATP-binding protein [Firmicutes bacterium HGW-Firmicutes-5]|nr:MAG: ATP-binding protein [Firmicutes bacterium HGW-Firmicutes-5]
MIHIDNLNYIYPKSGKHAIKGIDFNIEKGEIFGFLGPSGAGKTTTQRLIIGLLTGYEGQIQILGKERRLWQKDIFEKIGVAFDFPNLYLKLTALENLKLIGSYYKNCPKDFDSLLDMVGLLGDKHQRVENFSKGMKMRLNFIRSIMHDPDLMFFDEPTSGLDPVNARIIKEQVLYMKSKGKTIFLTTHNMTVAEQLCDHVAFINDGVVSAIDKPSNLMVEHGSAYVKLRYIHNNQEMETDFPLSGLGDNKTFKAILEQDRIITIHSGEATLEDVFIKFTGRKLIG